MRSGLGGRYPRLCLAAALCQEAADGRRAVSSFQLFWSSRDGLSCSGLSWAGAGPEIQSLTGTHSLGLRMGCPVPSCKLGTQHQLLCWRGIMECPPVRGIMECPHLSYMLLAPKPFSVPGGSCDRLLSLDLAGMEGHSAAKHNMEWKRSSGLLQDSRYVRTGSSHSPSDGNSH